jgi:hypothetical protein
MNYPPRYNKEYEISKKKNGLPELARACIILHGDIGLVVRPVREYGNGLKQRE